MNVCRLPSLSLVIGFMLLLCHNLSAQIDPENITIVRDEWGVPHIYGNTDADAAYGLAWVSCEDHFETMQQSLLAVNGMLGRVKGKDGAILDAIAFAVDVEGIVDSLYEDTFSDEFKEILEAYTQAINDYAEQYPKKRVRKKLFPIDEQDIVMGSVLAMGFMTTVQDDLQRIFNGNITNQENGNVARGSNALAFNSNKTTDGKTYLAINSHQPLKGPYSWYEVHVNSREGWNMLGGTFPGGTSVFVGTNPNLGWGHTLHYSDMSDVYKLEMHPKKKLMYKFDGEWRKLEKRVAKLRVKVLGFIPFPVRKKFYWSVYGPTFKNKEGFYSIRFPANLTIGQIEQWFHMNKAQNMEEFMDALERHQIQGTNIVYADRADNIFMISAGHFPYRDDNYTWNAVLPGDTSATLWKAGEYHPVDELIQVLNPKCGYLFNMNNTEYNCTCKEENPRPEKYRKYNYGHLSKNTGRSVRFMEMIEQYDKVSYEDFKTMKYDLQHPNPLFTRTAMNMEEMLHLDPNKYPDIADAIAVLGKWNRQVTIDNEQAAVFSLSLQHIIDYLDDLGKLDYNNMIPEEVYADAIRFAKEHLMKHFGQLEIPLGDLQKLVRGDKELPLWGTPEVMAQMYTDPHEDGKYKGVLGETYIQLLQYDEDGVTIESVNCFGASGEPESPHFDDQMDMFVQQKTKPMTLNKQEVFRNAKYTYHPGEVWKPWEKKD